jgi:arginine-tRNA-protein transferase
MKSLLTFVTPPGPCEYLRDRTWQLQYELVARATPDEYLDRLHAGWRRFGHAMFRPACPSCDMCRSLRVLVADFQPSRSQRRAWRDNRDLTRRIGAPSRSWSKEALWDRFQRHQHESKGWPLETADYDDTFVVNPFPTEEWCYYDGDRLIAVGYVDRLRDGLSAIYCYYDPDARHRSPGTFNILALIAAARTSGLPYVYLGYFVEGCRSLAYKGTFRPNEVLDPHGAWRPFRTVNREAG